MVAKNLLGQENVETLMQVKAKPHPYDIIWNRMIYHNGRLITSVRDFKSLKVKFITFNYDRSLEYFLFETCRATFNINHTEAYKLVQELNIIHLYGSLLEDPKNLETTFTRSPYGKSFSDEEVYQLSEKIDFMRISSPSLKDYTITDIIEDAKNIVFLGFGFDEFNLSKLGELILKYKNVFASGYNISEARRETLSKKLVDSSINKIIWEDDCDNCLNRAFLKIN